MKTKPKIEKNKINCILRNFGRVLLAVVDCVPDGLEYVLEILSTTAAPQAPHFGRFTVDR